MIRKSVALVILAILGLLVMGGLAELPLPAERMSESVTSRHILSEGVSDTGAVNLVTAVLFDYRGFDTLGEATVIFAAAAGVVLLFFRHDLPTSRLGLSSLAKRSIMVLAPFVFVTGLYIVMFGHVTPGGGFQGGVVWATLTILLCIVYGTAFEWRFINTRTKTLLESLGAIAFILLGLVGIYRGDFFLSNIAAGFRAGVPGELTSGGAIPLLNLAIGLKVAAGLALIFYNMVKKDVG